MHIDINVARHLEAEGVHHAEVVDAESTVVALAVSHHDGTDTAVQGVNILVVRCRNGGKRTH